LRDVRLASLQISNDYDLGASSKKCLLSGFKLRMK